MKKDLIEYWVRGFMILIIIGAIVGAYENDVIFRAVVFVVTVFVVPVVLGFLYDFGRGIYLGIKNGYY